MRPALLIAAVTLLLPSCVDDFEQAAVTAVGGGLRVVFRPCAWLEPVEVVRLVEPNGQIIGDGDDPVLWEVTNDGGRSTTQGLTFGPHTVTPGYTETIPLDAPVAGAEVAIYLNTRDDEGFSVTFPWGSLRVGVFVTEAGRMTREEWLDYADRGC